MTITFFCHGKLAEAGQQQPEELLDTPPEWSLGNYVRLLNQQGLLDDTLVNFVLPFCPVFLAPRIPNMVDPTVLVFSAAAPQKETLESNIVEFCESPAFLAKYGVLGTSIWHKIVFSLQSSKEKRTNKLQARRLQPKVL
ncbi:hypothetical protein BSKO_05271 [Bryopsis sp. KO-2023]|nr:hypothetical protein BSKO_05271 [Bryopsis sp. KO-2023]